MDILKRISFRAFDACIIAMLIWGDGNMQAFGLCVAALMTVVAWVGMHGLKLETAIIIHSSPFSRVIGIIVNLAYTAALIISGSPIWAAFYILGFAAIRLNAAKIVAEKGLPNAAS